MNQQKTWLELLGPCTDMDFVNSHNIVRCIEKHKYKILWTFESNNQAAEVFEMWKRETYVMQNRTPNKLKLNLSIRLTDRDVIDILRDKIAVENPGIVREKIKVEIVWIGPPGERYQDGYRFYLEN